MTIFTIPKPFRDHNAVIQHNAIQSWMSLYPHCEIILFGDEEGIEEYAKMNGLRHIPDIALNELGTPRLDFVFKRAQELAKFDTMCYVNADIIFTANIIEVVSSLRKLDKFLGVGQRLNVDVEYKIDYSSDWEHELKGILPHHSGYAGPCAIDYFIFTKSANINLLAFLVGRKGWDNWMIYDARRRGIPVIDLTPSVVVYHQNHDYKHVPFQRGNKWDGIESDYNIKLIGGGKNNLYSWSLLDANYSFSRGKLCNNPITLRELFRKFTLVIPKKFHFILDFTFSIQQKARILRRPPDSSPSELNCTCELKRSND